MSKCRWQSARSGLRSLSVIPSSPAPMVYMTVYASSSTIDDAMFMPYSLYIVYAICVPSGRSAARPLSIVYYLYRFTRVFARLPGGPPTSREQYAWASSLLHRRHAQSKIDLDIHAGNINGWRGIGGGECRVARIETCNRAGVWSIRLGLGCGVHI